jgi:hypothetical protein
MFHWPMGKLKRFINEIVLKRKRKCWLKVPWEKKLDTKPLLTYRIDSKSPLDKLKGKV